MQTSTVSLTLREQLLKLFFDFLTNHVNTVYYSVNSELTQQNQTDIRISFSKLRSYWILFFVVVSHDSVSLQIPVNIAIFTLQNDVS
jgi:hypothetical protein